MKNPFRSPQKWIYKYIPKREYSDKVELIPEFLFGCVIEFVESEKCFEYINYSDSTSHKKFARDLKRCYFFVKRVRPFMQQSMDYELDEATKKNPLVWKESEEDDSLLELEESKYSYEELYGRYNYAEENLKKQEQKYMKWIVKNVDHLWT
tara:strand:+ start:152 stop:604 length:453 start_codon:yes stop_codon:yes gene_type:complete